METKNINEKALEKAYEVFPPLYDMMGRHDENAAANEAFLEGFLSGADYVLDEIGKLIDSSADVNQPQAVNLEMELFGLIKQLKGEVI